MIPLTRPAFPDLSEIEPCLEEIWRSGQVTLGRYTRLFEEEVAALLGVRQAVAVSSCTAGLMLSLRALGLRGEVIVPSFTFAATVHAIVWNGLVPVFCEVEPTTAMIDAGAAEQLITERTCAMMPVYAYGAPPDMDALEALARRRRLALISDAAQGLGARYCGRWAGTFGDAEVFSLSPTKVITAVEGGLVTTNRPELAQRIRQLRDYGKSLDEEEGMAWIGLSARMSEVHAVIGLLNLRRQATLVRRRLDLIKLYREGLEGVPRLTFQALPSGAETSGNFMPVFIDGSEAQPTRDEVYVQLQARLIQTKRHFFPPAHWAKVYRESYGHTCLPITERLAREALVLPLYHAMTESTVGDVCRTVRDVLG
jgi:dTDP-4-amino-4,6-dideoxygalactose transaminase